MTVLLQDVALVTATVVGAPGVDAHLLAQLAQELLTLIHILLLLHCVGSFTCCTNGESLLGELTV